MARSAPKFSRRRQILLAALLAGSVMVIGRGVELQGVQAEGWRKRALDQQRERLTVPAPRGTIYDRNGIPLAASREMFRVAVAPQEVKGAAATASKLRSALGLSSREASRVLSRRRRWVVIPGLYDVEARRELEGVRGVHFERVLERFNPRGGLDLALLGRVSPQGRALSGLELEYDSLLSGVPGETVVRRDARGRPIPGAMLTVREPVPGKDIYLTIDAGLQEIGSEALSDALDETHAAGGDLIIADPSTGGILAAVSERRDGFTTWTGALDPYEPGSTLKPFLVATLLATHRARMSDSVFAENGVWHAPNGRTIRDVERMGWLTLHDALEYSSNIAMAKMSARLDPDTQYRYLRAFGFGSPTGVSYPAESAGLLRTPTHWTAYSQQSLAFGYEIAVTPLQMAAAYGALANGGVLMEPRLVREVRARDGTVLERIGPQPVRRVISEAVANKVRGALRDVVKGGTGQEASLGAFPVAGKTGTARRIVDGHYQPGAYSASFAGFFPVKDPQLVFLVKLDRPRGDYYGGATAAPVMRRTLAAALAARHAPLNRGAVLASQRAGATSTAAAPTPTTAAGSDGDGSWAGAPARPPALFSVDSGPPAAARQAGGGARDRPVPRVMGLPLRDAARRLFLQGFEVKLRGAGTAAGTDPAQGAMLAPGSVVVVRGREGAR